MQVFISHSGADSAWAGRLARALAGFRPPGGARLSPVLPSSGDADATRRAIEAADWLIVICSPRAAASDLIADEIAAFGRPDRILRLVVDGEPDASRHADLARQECLPRPLRGRKPAESADIRPDRDGWPGAWRRLAAKTLGLTMADLDDARRRAGRRLRLAIAGLGLCLAAALVLLRMTLDDNRLAARAEAARAGALTALTLLDEGRPLRALDAFAAATKGAPAGFPWPEETRIAAARLLSEARQIADHPAPSRRITRLAWLPDGALAASQPDGATYLVDPVTGDAALVYDPPGRAFTRLSPDGRKLWAARFEPTRRDQAGEPYAPLVFEDVDLSGGETALRAAVPATPAANPSAAISPDGELFAVDLGPGAAGDTVIAVFHRDAQALAGVLSLPSDRAALRFLRPDILLARTDPPGGPGLYLWRIGDDRPRTLRAPRDANGCGGAAAGAALDAEGAEIALLSPGCLDRWSAGGAAHKPLPTPAPAAEGLIIAAPERLYALTAERSATLLNAEGGLSALPRCGAPVAASRDAGGAPVILCGGGGLGATRFAGGLLTRGRWHLRTAQALAHDPDRARLATIGFGRLRIWDAAPPLGHVARLAAPPRLSAEAGRVVASREGGADAFSPEGRALGPAAAPAPAPAPQAESRCPRLTGGAAPLARSPSGARAVFRSGDRVIVADLARCLALRRIDIAAEHVAAALPTEDALWLALGRELYMAPLALPMAPVMKTLRTRAAALRRDMAKTGQWR